MKRKMWKRIAAGLLAGIMLMGAAGCGKNGGGEAKTDEPSSSNVAEQSEDGQKDTVVKGRYMEQQIKVPEDVTGIESMVRLSDGSIAFLNMATGAMVISKDNGDSWEIKELPALADKWGITETEITSHAIAPDGGVFFSYVDWTQESGEEGSVNEIYVYIDPEGNASEVTLTNESGMFFYLSDAVFTGEKTLIGEMNGGSPKQIDLEAGTIREMNAFSEEYSTICAAGDYLLSKELVYQLSEENTVEDAVLTDFIRQETEGYNRIAFCYDAAENTLYSASPGGLYSHVIGGSTMENLLDGGLCAMGDPTKMVSSILKNGDDSFLVAFEDGEIDLYTYDKDAPSVPTRQLVVYSLNQNMTVSKAISMFRKSNPDVYVKQEIGLLGDYGVTKEDAIRNLNTRLLAGEGPDIVLMDDMPLQSYIEKGILSNLGDVAKELEGSGAYFSNVLRAYENENGLYAIPIRFQIPVLIGEKGQIEGISDFKSFAETVNKAREAHPDTDTVLGTYTAEELIKRLYMLSSYAFETEEGADSDAIRSFLEQASAIYKDEQKNITEQMLRQHNDSMVWREDYGVIDEWENFSINASGMYEMISNEQLLMIGKISGMQDFQMTEGLVDNKDGITYDFMEASDGKLFVPYGIAGISEKSKEKELAAAFLKALLGTDVQKTDLEDGFPVNADAYDMFTQTDNPDATVGFSASVAEEDGSTSGRVNFSASWPTEEEIVAFKEKIGTLTSPALSDDVIFTAVLEGGVKVLEGDLSLDEGCGEIVQKVELYLAE